MCNRNWINETVLLRLWFFIDVRKDLNILETQTEPADQSFEPVNGQMQALNFEVLRTN